MRKVVAIVVTYNRLSMLLECIHSLERQENEVCDILVIDNASTDDTGSEMRKLESEGKIIYCNTGENLGGAGGFQYGIREAYKRGYEFFWLMDDDTYPEKSALSELMKADQQLKGEYGFLSSAAYWKDGTLCNMNIQRSTVYKKQTDFVSPLSPIVMATFVSFFVKRSVVKAVGLPIKEFFIWSDDLEYSRRISRTMPCYLVSGSKVVHMMNSNQKVGIEQEEDNRLWRYEYLYRNEVYVYRREGIKGLSYLVARVFLHSYRVIRFAQKEKKKKLHVIWRSFIKGFTFNPTVEQVE